MLFEVGRVLVKFRAPRKMLSFHLLCFSASLMASLTMGFSYIHHQQLFPRILDDLALHDDLRQFTQLLRDNEMARKFLAHRELTLLAPTDDAFDAFKGRYDAHLVLYHMLSTTMSKEELMDSAQDGRHLTSVLEELPYLWPSSNRKKDALFINDAQIIDNETDYESRTRADIYGKLQFVHKMDKVLSAMSSTPSHASPTAYDFLSQTNSWHLMPFAFERFLKRVIVSGSVPLYKDATRGTFLMPADEYRNSGQDVQISDKVIKCAILRKVVFLPSEEMADNKQLLDTLGTCQVTLVGPTALQVRDHRGVMSVQVLIANIPLKNGVVHVVRQVPGLFKVKMAPAFPFKSIWEHVDSDWRLETSTRLIQAFNNSEFDNIITKSALNYTLFLPTDVYWEKFTEINGKSTEDLLKNKHLKKFMSRHLTEGIYDTERLLEVAENSLRGNTLSLGTQGDRIMAGFTLHEAEGQVVITWGTKIMRIIRPNILCTNGILHLVDSPFIFDDEVRDEGNLLKFWKSIRRIMY